MRIKRVTNAFQYVLLAALIGAYLSTLKLINEFNESSRPVDAEIEPNLNLHYTKPAGVTSGRLDNFTLARDNGLVDEQRKRGKLSERPNHTSPIEQYFNYDEMTGFLRQLSNKYPDIMRLYSIGHSVEGRKLWVVLITESVTNEQVQSLRPNVQYVANMHGDEPVGRQLLMKLAAHLAESYYAPGNSSASSQSTKELVRTTRIHLVPSMNPDGFERSREGDCPGSFEGRLNANGVDLNRNFPDFFEPNASNTAREFPQPETRAVQLWLDRYTFVLAANMHGGALVASYPNDNAPQNFPRGVKSRAPDDDVIQHLASTYSATHKKMRSSRECPNSHGKPFPGGIVNGFSWYKLAGGMQDYAYYTAGFIEITLELSCCKYPKHDRIADFWDDNKDALVAYLREANKRAVRGFIRNSETGEPLRKASLRIRGRERALFCSSEEGEFWRILLPGSYVIEARFEGFEPLEQPVLVHENQATTLTLSMKPLAERKYNM